MGIDVVQPHPGKILHFKGYVDGYRFEWHPLSENVYFIRIQPRAQEIGELLAENIKDHGAALMATAYWCRGYKERDAQLPTKGMING